MKEYIISKLLLPLVRGYLVKKMEDDTFKEKIITIVNEKVDIPNLSEEAEQKLCDNLYETLELILKGLVEEK